MGVGVIVETPQESSLRREVVEHSGIHPVLPGGVPATRQKPEPHRTDLRQVELRHRGSAIEPKGSAQDVLIHKTVGNAVGRGPDVVEHPLHAEPFRQLNAHGKSPGGLPADAEPLPLSSSYSVPSRTSATSSLHALQRFAPLKSGFPQAGQ
jgi:hypothetical protein